MVGVFDLGSNSFISLIVDGKREIFEEVVVASTVSYVENGKFRDCSKLREIFSEMLKGVLRFTRNIHVFGTAVFRDVENGEWCFEEIRDGYPGKILTPEEEAKYSYLSAKMDEEIRVESPLVFDLGGGSLEVVNDKEWISLPLGTRKIGEVNGENFREKVDYVKKNLPDFQGSPVGIGGTFVTIASSKFGKWDLSSVHGSVINMVIVENLFNLIKDMSSEEIDSLPFVPEGRGKTLKSGLAIAAAIVEKFGDMVVSRRGYRYAIAWKLEGCR